MCYFSIGNDFGEFMVDTLTKDQLITKLQAALSWEVAPIAPNPAYQAWLEYQRKLNPLYVNPLGIHDPRYKELFDAAHS